ncbi:MAG: SseB family protein [Prosthecobacter sp.]
MSHSPHEDWRPEPEEPEPQNALERLIQQAAEDPSVQGKMFRLMMESDLYVYVPPHPELIGEHTRRTDEGFIWCTYKDEEGAFAAVFTSQACASYELRNLKNSKEPRPMICELPGDVLFGFLNNGQTTVRVMASGGGTIKMKPDAVASLVAGKFTHNRVSDGDEGKESVALYPVPDEKVPAKLRQAIRVFCAQRRVPIGVYVFHQVDTATGTVPGNDLRVILWLRGADNDFYNDFCLMAQKLTPMHLEFFCAVVTSEDTQAVAFLQKQKPLWPILKVV